MRYTEIAKATPFEGAPKINTPRVFGASPKKPILIKICASGKRPMTYGAIDLPEGLSLYNGIITGKVDGEGSYKITLKAKNELGECKKQITLEIKRDAVQLTPLMGFTSWNAFGYGVTQADLEKTADRMSELGLDEYGYNFINIDSGWQGEYGGKYDAIQPNEKFPDIKGFCDRMHSRGYRCGIYSTPMLHAFGTSMSYRPLPLGCTQGEPDDRFGEEHGGIGVIRKEKNNALQWAEWGFDYLKYDWRPCDPYNAELMRAELVKTERDFGFCVSVKARPEYHKYWEKYCSSYRCNPDSMGNWDNLMTIYRTYFDFIDYVNKGHYFDLDMLDLGRCILFEKLGFTEEKNFGYTEDEALVAYSMRAFLSSPIQISCTLETVSDFELSMYCNDEIIEINQDTAFSAARPVIMLEDGKKIIHVFKKKLAEGDTAYAVFNLGETEETVNVYLDGESSIRDVWAKKDLPTASKITVATKPHTVKIYRIAN